MSPAPTPWSVADLLAGFVDDAPAIRVSGLEMDSRRIKPGCLFLACAGTREHGLRHLPQALANGAVAVAWEPMAGVDAPHVSAPSVPVAGLARKAGLIAARFYHQPSAQMTCIGVTGTDGKTSTAHLIAQAMEKMGRSCIYFGTLGYGRLHAMDAAPNTTPGPVDLQRRLARARADGVERCVMEVSSHGLSQERVAGVEFDCAVLTNIGRDHLDYHGSHDAYVAAKRKLFERTESAVLNLDDEFGMRWFAELRGERRVVGYGVQPGRSDAGVWADKPILNGSGLGFDVCVDGERHSIQSGLLGYFNVYNLLAALAALLESGFAAKAACDALSAATTVPGRAEAFRRPRRALVVVDYAHTPQALEQILKGMRPHVAGRLWCVFGCGGDRDVGKRPLMGEVAARLADQLIVTDDNPRSESPDTIVADILRGIENIGGGSVEVVHDRAQAIRSAIVAAEADDVVLVAGKGHEDYQIYGSERRHFSDREAVAELLETSGLAS